MKRNEGYYIWIGIFYTWGISMCRWIIIAASIRLSMLKHIIRWLNHSSTRITLECAFGETDLRCDVFWKILTCRIQYFTTTIEGDIQLHNCVADYGDTRGYSREYDVQQYTLIDNCCDSGIFHFVVGNTMGLPTGRTIYNEIDYRLNDSKLRDKLILSIMDHGLHCTRLEE